MNDIAIEIPQPGARVHDQAITVVVAIQTEEPPKTVTVWCEDECVGATHVFSRVAAHEYRFRLLGRFADAIAAEREAILNVRVQLGEGAQTEISAERAVVIVPAELGDRPYGHVAPTRADLLHRDDIYGSGPPVETPSEEAAALVRQFLPGKSSVLDVGCGAGAFAATVISAGRRWFGVEVQPACAEILTRRGLPFRQLEKGDDRLPFTDNEFDAAIAIEVLEHVENPSTLIAEVARVTRSRFLVSVPNIEIIPYLAPLGVVPWHLLEATHLNFFTRASLHAILQPHFRRVEVFSYGEHPVRTHDGVPVHVHLFAVADR